MKSLSAPEGPLVKMEHLDRYFYRAKESPIEILVPFGSLSKGPQMKEASTRVQNPSTPPSSRLHEMSSLCRPPNTNVSPLLTVHGNEDMFKVKSTRLFVSLNSCSVRICLNGVETNSGIGVRNVKKVQQLFLQLEKQRVGEVRM